MTKAGGEEESLVVAVAGDDMECCEAADKVEDSEAGSGKLVSATRAFNIPNSEAESSPKNSSSAHSS